MADNNEIFDLITKMHSEMQEMKSDIKDLKNDVTKNTVTLENMNNNIKLLAEGQEAFREQMGRSNEQDTRTVTDRLETIEIAVTHTSKSISYLAGAVDVVKNTTASNDIDIKILKRLQNNPSM